MHTAGARVQDAWLDEGCPRQTPVGPEVGRGSGAEARGQEEHRGPGRTALQKLPEPGPGQPRFKTAHLPSLASCRATRDPRPAVSPAASDGKRPLRLVAGAEGKCCPAPSARLPGGTWAGCSRQHKAGAPNPHPGIGESGPQRETGRRLAFPRLGREGTASVPCHTRTQSPVPPRLRAGTDSGQGTCHPVTAATGRSGVRLRTRTLQVWLDQAPRSS